MAFQNLREDLDDLFGEFTGHAEEMSTALDTHVAYRRAWLLAYWKHRETLRPERGRARGAARREGQPGKTRKLNAQQRSALRAVAFAHSRSVLAEMFGTTEQAISYHRAQIRKSTGYKSSDSSEVSCSGY